MPDPNLRIVEVADPNLHVPLLPLFMQVAENDADAIYGSSKGGSGLVGLSETSNGVYGSSTTEAAVYGQSVDNDGVRGISTHGNGVSAFGGNTGIYAKGSVNAGFFEGNVFVTGTLSAKVDIVLSNGDCAEDFDIVPLTDAEPGTVMMIDSEGALKPSDCPYDKRVAGVISGAGSYKPGIILDKQESVCNRLPIALMGKVYCKVDAGYGAIEVGDLLTTSATPGHAMKVCDPLKAPGSVIGKALRSLAEGQGLVPILIALQ